MSNMGTPQTNPISAREIRTPPVILWMFGLSPFLMLFGGFLRLVMSKPMTIPEPRDYAIFQSWLGLILLLLGLAFFVIGAITVATRSMLQQQTAIITGTSNR